jgi:poly(3-hydroxybutyrate) depolymerase
MRAGAKVARPVPVIVFHGDRDAVVHPSNGQATFHQFAQAAGGRGLEQREERGPGHTRITALDAAGRVAAEHWTLHGAGHAWSGGSTAGSYAVASGPDASSEMLRFFLSR